MPQTASIIDYPRGSLDPEIWDVQEDRLALQPEIKDQIMDIVESFLDDVDLPTEALIDIFIYGSILTNQWNDNTDVDARILLDPDIISEIYTDITGDDLYEVSKDVIHDVPLGDTKHPFNATVVIKGEETLLGQSPLGTTERDPVYSIKDEELINIGKHYDESFDPDVEFEKERDETSEIMNKLDKLIQETRTDTIDYATIEEAVAHVTDPNKLMEKLERKLLAIEEDVAGLVHHYQEIKDERSESYKEGPEDDRHKAPGNIRFKMLEKYKYMDVLKKLKRIFEGGVQESEVDDIADVLSLEGYTNVWPGPTADPEAPPTLFTGPVAPRDKNPLSFGDGGMMHGASCPHCGHVNPITAKPESDEIQCQKCGKKFKDSNQAFTVNTGPSLSTYTQPYESDVKIYGMQVSEQDVEEMAKILRDLGVADYTIEQIREKLTTDNTENLEPKAPEAPNAPASPMAPESPESPSTMNVLSPPHVKHPMQPGKPMKQLTNKEEFLEDVKIGKEYKNPHNNEYGVIVEEMAETHKGAYRVQWYSSNMPLGHTTVATFESAANKLYDELGPIIESAEGSLDKFALSGSWIKFIHRNKGKSKNKFESMDASVATLKEAHLNAAIVILGKVLMRGFEATAEEQLETALELLTAAAGIPTDDPRIEKINELRYILPIPTNEVIAQIQLIGSECPNLELDPLPAGKDTDLEIHVFEEIEETNEST
jgi:hypothetical protein